ncbi:MAG: SUMF1/EgtB/PvdO family nonheme iron enzyme [Cyanobacteriota bacterium]|nr:SUMF1/EgtB/PvdO family nonheme iron enzyme [Cyanobacteriota bacterium]
MGLTGSERKKLRQAIINAYPSKAKLKMMVSDELEENLDAIAGGENLDEIVFNFIEWAESQGKIQRIIDAAIRTNPGNQQLREFQQSTPNELTQIVSRILDGSRDEKDIAKLKESLQMADDGLQWKSQNGKFINNIGQITGGEVQFGDRTYHGADAQTIKTVILEALPEIIQSINVENSPQAKTDNTKTTDYPTQQLTSKPPPRLTNFEFEVVTVDSQGKEIKRCYKQAEYFTENLDDETVLEMVSIPGGKFSMGTSKDEKASDENERPQHIVTIQPFFISKYPITQAQWKFVANLPKIKRELKLEPSYFKGLYLPVELVSWYDAQEFCQRLSHKTGRIYRLPSEAQWEYACRARNSTPFHFGKTIITELANYCGQNEQTTEVGSFSPNNFGLYDMHGNVWEWCADYEHEDYLDAPTDGSVWIDDGSEEYRILRGGSWNSPANLCRSAFRFSENSTVTDREFGFRVICY